MVPRLVWVLCIPWDFALIPCFVWGVGKEGKLAGVRNDALLTLGHTTDTSLISGVKCPRLFDQMSGCIYALAPAGG